MGMYAVLYRLRRIRFFYQLFFYFNYVTAPALILLPAWIANELLQHLLGGQGIAYMAHLGGLLTGAALMAAAMRLAARRARSSCRRPPRPTRFEQQRGGAQAGRGDEVRRGLRGMARRGAAPAGRCRCVAGLVPPGAPAAGR